MQNPLGQYGAPTAALLAVVIVLAALVSHVVPGATPSAWLDNAALIVVGVVFGAQVVQNGTQVKAAQALSLAQAAHDRLNAVGAPQPPLGTGTPSQVP
jgi:hypothetical protein